MCVVTGVGRHAEGPGEGRHSGAIENSAGQLCCCGHVHGVTGASLLFIRVSIKLTERVLQSLTLTFEHSFEAFMSC